MGFGRPKNKWGGYWLDDLLSKRRRPRRGGSLHVWPG